MEMVADQFSAGDTGGRGGGEDPLDIGQTGAVSPGDIRNDPVEILAGAKANRIPLPGGLQARHGREGIAKSELDSAGVVPAAGGEGIAGDQLICRSQRFLIRPLLIKRVDTGGQLHGRFLRCMIAVAAAEAAQGRLVLEIGNQGAGDDGNAGAAAFFKDQLEVGAEIFQGPLFERRSIGDALAGGHLLHQRAVLGVQPPGRRERGDQGADHLHTAQPLQSEIGADEGAVPAGGDDRGAAVGAIELVVPHVEQDEIGLLRKHFGDEIKDRKAVDRREAEVDHLELAAGVLAGEQDPELGWKRDLELEGKAGGGGTAQTEDAEGVLCPGTAKALRVEIGHHNLFGIEIASGHIGIDPDDLPPLLHGIDKEGLAREKVEEAQQELEEDEQQEGRQKEEQVKSKSSLVIHAMLSARG